MLLDVIGGRSTSQKRIIGYGYSMVTNGGVFVFSSIILLILVGTCESFFLFESNLESNQPYIPRKP